MNPSPNTKESVDANLHEDLQHPPKEEVIEHIPAEKLKNESRQRAKKQPILQKIARALSSQKHEPYRELIINAEPLETRVALLVDGVLDKFEVERSGEQRMVGAIFKGKIQNLENGLKAAFVDIGQPKNAFLHYWDIIPGAQEDSTIEIVRDTRSEASKTTKVEKPNLKDIPKLFPIGTEIILQITKGQIGSKGPRTTTNLALPGRFLVLMPFSGQCGVSRKIEQREERDRLKGILRGLQIPEGMGVIIRTAGEGKKHRFFVRDLHMLLKKWEDIQHRLQNEKGPTLLYQEPDIIERTVRDFLTESIDRVLVDSDQRHRAMIESVNEISPRSRRKIAQFTDDIPIFERFNIERQIEQTFQRRVPLPGGGEIVIEETEALVAIDVNTGGHRGKDKDGKNYIVNVNLEAASEIARQVRLRNIGGLIIMDFIDMKSKKDRNAVLSRMRREMAQDKAKNHILPISPLGIMQMTRQRHSESHSSGIYEGCPYCTGKGIVKSPRSMSVEIQRRLVSIIRHARANDTNVGRELNMRVLIHPTNLERLRREDAQHLIDIEQAYNVQLSFRADPAYHVENFRILDAETGKELR
ncbi:Rne/Rng family ribonuclease [Cerasicoccus arenae]|uniref:Ribonuclease G n=1 Tax=Cerasicoccus arenae TaxID=424488 RepID=A0A8J3DC77_9BACT|nr:Rne/Rng family ribonuclease [Cerasicoccus arenae]MBK1858833.1 Rne/Rng family ribonuclease [Cerasicoccus arenae]GHC04327.1 ribonuclease G [Cerasicoccus arenae]